MPGSPSRALVVAAVLAGLITAGTSDPATARDASGPRVLFSFTDDRIDESSGLVVRDGLALTVNDSGDDPVVYAVAAASGDTVGVTAYSSDDVVDVEALAPGIDGGVWVGDLGDNRRARSSVDVYRLGEVGAGERTVQAARYTFTYPGGPSDAETLLVHPRTGRLFVVSKELLRGGTVYRAPRKLDESTIHRLAPVAAAPRMVTDGTFLPDGRHLLLRTYSRAVVYTFPGFELVGEFELPEQEQGEAVAVDEAGRLVLTSEGEGSEVLRIDLPADVAAALGATPTQAAPSPEPAANSPDTAAQASDAPAPASPEQEAEDGDRVWFVAGFAVFALVAGLLVRAFLRRSRRKR